MKPNRYLHKAGFFFVLSFGVPGWAGADGLPDPPPLINPEVSLLAPTDRRVVLGSVLQPLVFTATNLNATANVSFDVGLTAGSVGSINTLRQPDATVIPSGVRVDTAPSTPWPAALLLTGNTGTFSATPNISGLTVGQSMAFGLQASNANWNAPVSASTNIGVVTNRLLTGSVTINAGRHIVGSQTIGSITLNGGTLTDSEATRIAVSSGGYAQLANGLRLTSTSDFTFNGANQTHDLQISYNGPTGNYSITSATLPGAGASTYTDVAGNQHQEFGGAWNTSAQYGNVFGEKRVFSEVLKSAYQPILPATRTTYASGNVTTTWELARGSGVLVNQRINPLISGEVIQGSNLNLSGVSLTVTGTAVSNRLIYGNNVGGYINSLVDIGRQMVGATSQTVNRNDTVTLTTYGSDANCTRLSLGAFALDNGGTVTATHTGVSAFTDGSSTASVQITGSFIRDSATQGRNYQAIDAASQITGEGLAGESVQGSLQVGYTWNNVRNNQLVAPNLLVIDSSTRSDTRSYSTYVDRVYSTETHTAIGWTGNEVLVSGTHAAGMSYLGNTTVRAVAEGLAGENASATTTFSTTLASVAEAAYSLTHTGQSNVPLTAGSVVTIRDNGSGIYQNNVQIDYLGLSGGQSLDYQLSNGGASPLLAHGQSQDVTIHYIGNSSTPLAGEMGRVSRANLDITLSGQINYGAIVSAWNNQNGGTWQDRVGSQPIGYNTFKLETRFDAPAAPVATAQVLAGTNLRVHGLALSNTGGIGGNSSDRFVQATSMELLDSATIGATATVTVEFVKLDNASPAVVAALENSGANAASLAGIYNGDSNRQTFVSDMVTLSGLNGVMQVLQVGYDSSVAQTSPYAQLLWQYNYSADGGSQVAWINAVLGNSNITDLNLVAGTLRVAGVEGTIQSYLTGKRFSGSYAQYLASEQLATPGLGEWGVDMDANKVWAVIDHNSTFVVVIPEPGISMLALLGFVGCMARRQRN